MTAAICIKCGAQKIGALVPCPECDFAPTEVLDRAKSVLLSDHHLDAEELAAAAERIRNDESVYYSEQELAQYVTMFEKEYLEARSQQRPSTPGSRLAVYAAIVLLPLAFFVLMFIGFRIGDWIMGRPADRPIKSGKIVRIVLRDADGTQFNSRRAALFDEYLRISTDGPGTIWLPREQVVSVEFED